MQKYIGIKLIEAEPITRGDYNTFRGWTIPANENPNDEGYKVKYSDSYVSWSPKDVFDKSYMAVSKNNTVTQENVKEFIKSWETSTIGDKTTMVRVTLVNGFEIIETSACVDKTNYNKQTGEIICLTKIEDKIWAYLGFLLQTAIGGVK